MDQYTSPVRTTAFLILLFSFLLQTTATAAITKTTIIGLDLGLPEGSLDIGKRLILAVLSQADENEQFGLVIADELVRTTIEPLPAADLIKNLTNLSLDASDTGNFSTLLERSLEMANNPATEANRLWVISDGEINLSTADDNTAKKARYQLWASSILLPEIASRYPEFRLISPKQNNPAIIDSVVSLLGEQGHQVLPDAEDDLALVVESLVSDELIIAATDIDLAKSYADTAATPDVVATVVLPDHSGTVNTVADTGTSSGDSRDSTVTDLPIGSDDTADGDTAISTAMLTEQATPQSSVSKSLPKSTIRDIGLTERSDTDKTFEKPQQAKEITNAVETASPDTNTVKADSEPAVSSIESATETTTQLAAITIEEGLPDLPEVAVETTNETDRSPLPADDKTQVTSVDKTSNQQEIVKPQTTETTSTDINIEVAEAGNAQIGMNTNLLSLTVAILATISTLALALMIILRKRGANQTPVNIDADTSNDKPSQAVPPETLVMAHPPVVSKDVSAQATTPLDDTIVMSKTHVTQDNIATQVNTQASPAVDETLVNPTQPSAPQSTADDFSVFDRSIIENRQAKIAAKKLEPSEDKIK